MLQGHQVQGIDPRGGLLCLQEGCQGSAGRRLAGLSPLRQAAMRHRAPTHRHRSSVCSDLAMRLLLLHAESHLQGPCFLATICVLLMSSLSGLPLITDARCWCPSCKLLGMPRPRTMLMSGIAACRQGLVHRECPRAMATVLPPQRPPYRLHSEVGSAAAGMLSCCH